MHKVYEAIVRALQTGNLAEPFTPEDFELACPGLGRGTYNAFLYKHRVGSHGRYAKLFIKVARGQFECIRPFKYGLDERKMRDASNGPVKKPLVSLPHTPQHRNPEIPSPRTLHPPPLWWRSAWVGSARNEVQEGVIKSITGCTDGRVGQ